MHQMDTIADRAGADQAGPTRRRSVRRLIVATTAVVAGFAVSSIAFAAWTLSGEGDGVAQASTAVDLVVGGLALDDDLYPGLTTSATLTVSNPNAFPVRITAVDFGVVQITGGDGCTVGNAAVTFADLTGLDLYLAPGADAVEHTLSNVVTMGAASNTGCQGAAFEATFTLDAESTTAP
jgi:hypothetical protein